MSMIMMYITYPSKESAEDMVNQLLEERLIGCGNIIPMQSCYWWEDDIHNDAEYISILKTSYKNAPYVEQYVEENHPYDVPCIVRWEMHCNLAYEKWLRSNISER